MKFKDNILKATGFAGRIAQTFRNVNYPKQAKSKPDMTVHAAVGDSRLWGNFFNDIVQSNTDYILRTRASGKSYDFYTEMEEKDPKLYGLIRTRKKAITGLPWDILPFVSGPGKEAKNRDVKIATEIKQIFEDLQKFNQDKYEVLDGIGKGFAVSEIVWNSNGHYGIEALKSRKQKHFVFDKQGRLRLVTQEHLIEGEPLPDRKFLIFQNEPYAENPYGSSILKYCYWYWWFKKNLVKWWAIFAEKFGSPHVVARYPVGVDAESKKLVQDLVDNFQNETGVALPEGIMLDFLEATRRGDAGYKEFLDYCDDQNAIAILGQTLTSAEGRRSGSLALGQVHDQVRQDILEDDGKNLDCVINQLIHWIVDYNWMVDGYPKYVTDSTPPEDLKARAERDKILFGSAPVGIGLPVATRFLYETYNVPEPKEGEDLLGVGSPAPPPIPGMREFAEFGRPRRKMFQIGNTMKLQDKLRKKLEEVYLKLEPAYLALLGENPPLKAAIDEMVRSHFDKLMRYEFNGATSEAVIAGVQSIADQFKLKVNRGQYLKWVDDYLKHRVYEKGKFENIGKTLSELLHNKARDLYDQKLTLPDIKKGLQAKFKDMADWKAGQIARTEIRSAANHGGIQMMKQSGMKVKAWFITDPAACPICQDQGAMNPYTLGEAENLGLPHPNCACMWAFTVEE